MEALTNLALLMEGQVLYFAGTAYQYDKKKGVMFFRSTNTVWAFTNFCVADFIRLSEKGVLTPTPDPAIWTNKDNN